MIQFLEINIMHWEHFSEKGVKIYFFIKRDSFRLPAAGFFVKGNLRPFHRSFADLLSRLLKRAAKCLQAEDALFHCKCFHIFLHHTLEYLMVKSALF